MASAEYADSVTYVQQDIILTTVFDEQKPNNLMSKEKMAASSYERKFLQISVPLETRDHSSLFKHYQ